jgi:uncharacterized protein YyaL (SSP411 family)
MFRFSVRPNRAHLIDWREWGEDAFEEARQQDKMVVLFIAAFWCGFCQRMDETALSDDETIALLNAFFIPIRVEESQRPDVDLRYNQDGWPTIAVLTPDGGHLFTVNYMDTDPFVDLLVKTVTQFQSDKEGLLAAATYPALATPPDDTEPQSLSPALVGEIAGMVEGMADQEHGGYGTHFKFLHTEANEFLLYLYETSGEATYLDHVTFTLDKMLQSLTFHSEDGGFYRYSSQPDWNEPHPEKLLEDQATLVGNFLHLYLLNGDSARRESAEGLIDYLNSTLLDQSGGAFFGCQDYVRPVEPTGADGGPAPMISVIDEYIYCDANARAAVALLDAWWVLGREDCRERAVRVLEVLWRELRAPERGMFHYSDGGPQAPGMLTDATAAGSAFLKAYSVLHDTDYLDRAKALAADIVRMHRSPDGGFFDISQKGPANLQVPIAELPQNAAAASFFVRLADLSGDANYREGAVWALKRFPGAHRQFGAFAAGFGQALGRLLTLPLVVTVNGPAGSPEVRALTRAAMTQLGHGDVVVKFQASPNGNSAWVDIEMGGRSYGPISDPAELTADGIRALEPR